MPRQLLRVAIPCLLLVCLLMYCNKEITPKYTTQIIQIDPADAASLAGKIRAESAVSVADGMALSVWASDTLVADPIAISVAPDGRIFYTSATRQTNSEFDIRGHRDWMTASISFQTVEDRREFLRNTFTTDSEQSERFLKDLNEDGVRDWRDLAVEKEQVWFVTDQSKDGFADQAQLYLEDFGEEVTDVANGVEYHDGEVYISVGPDLWRTSDKDQDGVADQTRSISHGFAVHIGFSGHGMSGVTVGPLGRIWWGIGDIGMNLVDKEGKHWKYPNRGVVVRADPDGSNFEVFAMGVRNTHEFAFDQYGNLISEDNDGDHRGERERLVYLIDGSDTGWRINWQFGKYTDPDNNDYKVWMDEQLHIPRWDGQAAYILPTITNYVNGPTGLVYNPGTALGPAWYNHFFVAEFRGNPTNSPIHAFTLKADGAGFALDSSREVVSGLLPTGLDFGADGALYFGDWVNGWGTKDAGRIWKLDIPGEENSAIRQATQTLIQADFGQEATEKLAPYLGHQDMRVRRKAQFALAARGKAGFAVLQGAATNERNQLARIHGIWGMTQQARQEANLSSQLVPFLTDEDPEIVAQAAKMIGDLRYTGAGDQLIAAMTHASPRVRFFATEALGRTANEAGIPAILDMLEENNDQDTWLRMGGMIALGRIGQEAPLVALAKHESRALRIAAVVALRRMESPEIAVFLKDSSEYIVAEAARAINDDFSILPALPALSMTLEENRFTSEPLLRRAINANLRVGGKEEISRLVNYITRTTAPVAMRVEALAALSTWGKPSVFDRVDGRYRGIIIREDSLARQQLSPLIADLLVAPDAALLLAAVEASAKLKITGSAPRLKALLAQHPAAEIRAASLSALDALDAEGLENAIALALKDQEAIVRARALEVLPSSAIEADEAVKLYTDIMARGTIDEQQAALFGLGQLDAAPARTYLGNLITQMEDGKLPQAVHLDLIEALQHQDHEQLNNRLDAYETAISADEDLRLYYSALTGGDPRAGGNIFYSNTAAQCTRCHAIFEYGGNVGPGLDGVGSRLDERALLTSLIRPSLDLAPGYETVLLNMRDSSAVVGIVMERNPEVMTLKIGKEDILTVDRSNILSEESLPSSMPSMDGVLSMREIRDLVAFLHNLKGEEF